MRTVEVKSVETGKVVMRGHYWSIDQIKKMAINSNLPCGNYLVQGTNSGACRPIITKKLWELAEKFEIERPETFFKAQTNEHASENSKKE